MGSPSGAMGSFAQLRLPQDDKVFRRPAVWMRDGPPVILRARSARRIPRHLERLRKKSPASLGLRGCHGDAGRKRKGLHRPVGTSSRCDRGVRASRGSRAPCQSGAPGCRNGGEDRHCVTGRGRSGPHMAGGKAVPGAKPGVHVGMLFASVFSNRLSFTDCRASEGSERRRAVRFPPCKPTNLAHQTSPTKTSFH